MHDVWHSRLSTSKHSNTPCLRHTDVVFIGQLKLVNNSFSNLALLQLFYKYTCIVVSSYLMTTAGNFVTLHYTLITAHRV